MFGCDCSAYVPVIAGGRNPLSIHYVRNDDIFWERQLVLADAGAEYGGYITNITRTGLSTAGFPMPKRIFTK